MIHDTVALLRVDLQKWLPVFKASLGLSQNAFARGAGVDQSIFSRWLRGEITSKPTADKVRPYLAKLKRRVVARERVTA